MSEVRGIEPIAGMVAGARAGQASSGAAFAVPAGSMAAPAAATLGGPVALSALLALQEAESAPVRDRDARRRGRDILVVLTELQRALLGGEGSDGVIARLTALTADQPLAANPRLNEIVAAIRLRARVELARWTGA